MGSLMATTSTRARATPMVAEDRRARAVAELDLLAFAPHPPRHLRVQVQDPVGDVHLPQDPGQVPPVETVADDDDVSAHVARRRTFVAIATVQRESEASSADDQQRAWPAC